MLIFKIWIPRIAFAPMVSLIVEILMCPRYYVYGHKLASSNFDKLQTDISESQ